jgi:hypothetical protein
MRRGSLKAAMFDLRGHAHWQLRSWVRAVRTSVLSASI